MGAETRRAGRRLLGRALMAVGVLLVAGALGLLALNAWEDRRAGVAAAAVAAQLEEARGAGDGPTPEPAAAGPAASSSDAMASVIVGGYAYVGTLTIPALGLDLPVMASWDGDYDALAVAPCRQFGSPQTHDLVIAGHNYASHFGGLSRLVAGDEVVFTDVAGREWRYRVALVETLAPEAVDDVRESPWDLTLYTCTYGGASRVVVRCAALA